MLGGFRRNAAVWKIRAAKGRLAGFPSQFSGKRGYQPAAPSRKEKRRSRRSPHTLPALEAVDKGCDVGYDTRTGIDDRDYHVPFRFTGKLDKVAFKPGPPEMTAEQMKRAAEMRAKGKD
jgi:hypothetical protein